MSFARSCAVVDVGFFGDTFLGCGGEGLLGLFNALVCVTGVACEIGEERWGAVTGDIERLWINQFIEVSSADS